jgi:hypothetical protein
MPAARCVAMAPSSRLVLSLLFGASSGGMAAYPHRWPAGSSGSSSSGFSSSSSSSSASPLAAQQQQQLWADLHNLSFVNTFANVSKDLYDNATVTFSISGGTPVSFDLADGAYSLVALELAIATALQPYFTQIGSLKEARIA